MQSNIYIIEHNKIIWVDGIKNYYVTCATQWDVYDEN